MNGRFAALTLVLIAVVFRTTLESSMATHMLVQVPMLFTAGVLSARSTSHRRQTVAANPIAAFVFATGVMTAWMIPRALDAAVEQPAIDALKCVSLVLAGQLAMVAWRASTHVVRTFVAGNSAWMTATAGVLYLEAPARLCTTYGRSEQQQTGIALISLTVLSVLMGGWWLIRRSDQSARSNAGSM